MLFSLGGSFLYYADRFKIYSAFCASHTKVPKVLAKGTNTQTFFTGLEHTPTSWIELYCSLASSAWWLRACRGSTEVQLTSCVIVLSRHIWKYTIGASCWFDRSYLNMEVLCRHSTFKRSRPHLIFLLLQQRLIQISRLSWPRETPDSNIPPPWSRISSNPSRGSWSTHCCSGSSTPSRTRRVRSTTTWTVSTNAQ